MGCTESAEAKSQDAEPKVVDLAGQEYLGRCFRAPWPQASTPAYYALHDGVLDTRAYGIRRGTPVEHVNMYGAAAQCPRRPMHSPGVTVTRNASLVHRAIELDDDMIAGADAVIAALDALAHTHVPQFGSGRAAGGSLTIACIIETHELGCAQGGALDVDETKPLDPANVATYGHGAVQHVKCGGVLVLRFHNVNDEDVANKIRKWAGQLPLENVTSASAVEAVAASVSVDFTMHGGVVSGESTADTAVQFSRNTTLAGLTSLVDAWAASLYTDPAVAVALRAGVARFSALKGVVPLVEPRPKASSAAPSEPIVDVASGEVAQLRNEIALLRSENERLAAELAEARLREGEPDSGAAPLVPASDSVPAAQRDEADVKRIEMLTEFCDALSTVVFEDETELLDSQSGGDRRFMAKHIARCSKGEVTEVEGFVTRRSPDNAALWAVISLLRSDAVTSVDLSQSKISDAGAVLLAAMVDDPRVDGGGTSLQLRVLRLTRNNITSRGGLAIMHAVLARGARGGTHVEVYLDDNRKLWRGDDAARLHALVQHARALGFVVDVDAPPDEVLSAPAPSWTPQGL